MCHHMYTFAIVCLCTLYPVAMSSSVKEGAASCGVGDTGKEGVTELSPDLLLKLKREYILPVQDVPLKLKKAWKVIQPTLFTYVHVSCTSTHRRNVYTPSVAFPYSDLTTVYDIVYAFCFGLKE